MFLCTHITCRTSRSTCTTRNLSNCTCCRTKLSRRRRKCNGDERLVRVDGKIPLHCIPGNFVRIAHRHHARLPRRNDLIIFILAFSNVHHRMYIFLLTVRQICKRHCCFCFSFAPHTAHLMHKRIFRLQIEAAGWRDVPAYGVVQFLAFTFARLDCVHQLFTRLHEEVAEDACANCICRSLCRIVRLVEVAVDFRCASTRCFVTALGDVVCNVEYHVPVLERSERCKHRNHLCGILAWI